MEFLIFSDIQYRQNHRCSYILENGISSWLQTQIDVTKQVFSYARENKIQYIFFNGDLFEDKNKIDVLVYNTIWGLFYSYSDEFKIVFNTGNHDIHTKNRSSSLSPFSDIVEVVTEAKDFELEDIFIRIIPYGMTEGNLGFSDEDYYNNNGNAKYDKCILLTHEDIAGLKLGPLDYTSGSKLKAPIFGDWDIVFNGHIHKPQDYSNICNIGSCMMQDFGEAGEEKSFIHYKDDEVIRVPFDCPRFVVIKGLSPKVEKKITANETDFFRINIEANELNNPIFNKYNVFHNIVKSQKREIRLKEQGSIEDEIREYISISNSELSEEKLFKVGKELTV